MFLCVTIISATGFHTIDERDLFRKLILFQAWVARVLMLSPLSPLSEIAGAINTANVALLKSIKELAKNSSTHCG